MVLKWVLKWLEMMLLRSSDCGYCKDPHGLLKIKTVKITAGAGRRRKTCLMIVSNIKGEE